jgi:hypothetical protein
MSPLASSAVSALPGAELLKKSGMGSQEAQARFRAESRTATQEFRRSFRLT